MGAAVHGNIIDLAFGHTHQLALGVVLLEMQAAQHAAGGAALVVLHELLVDAGSSKLILLVGLHEISAVITEHLRLNDHNTRDLGLSKRKLAHISFSSLFSFRKFCLFVVYGKVLAGFCAIFRRLVACQAHPLRQRCALPPLPKGEATHLLDPAAADHELLSALPSGELAQSA